MNVKQLAQILLDRDIEADKRSNVLSPKSPKEIMYTSSPKAK